MKREFLEALEERLKGSSEYGRLADAGPEAAAIAVGLPPAAAAWVCHLKAEELDRPALVVVPREGDAMAWVEAAAWLGGEASYFPPQNLTPYQEVEVPASVRSREIVALDAWRRHRRLLVATPRALFRRLPTVAGLEEGSLEIAAGDEIRMSEVAAHLAAHGYERVDLVSDVGEFAVRGGVLDLFGAGAEQPLRLDYFGDTLDSLRYFSLEDQRSGQAVERARVLPMSLFASDRAAREGLADRLSREHALAPGDPAIAALREGGGFPGWEAHLCDPQDSCSLTDWLSDAWLVACESSVLAEEIEAYGRQLSVDFGRWRESGKWALPPEAARRGSGRRAGSDRCGDPRHRDAGGGHRARRFQISQHRGVSRPAAALPQ